MAGLGVAPIGDMTGVPLPEATLAVATAGALGGDAIIGGAV